MKIVLLGANGQLGSDISYVFYKSNYDMHLIKVTRKNVDISDLSLLSDYLEGLDFDVLVNCTAYNRVDDAQSFIRESFIINSHAVQKMAQVCQLKGAKFFHVSTDYVFGGNKSLYDEPLTESTSPAPINVYGASKLLGENLARLACDNTFILRVASLFGVAGSSGKGGNFVETMIKFAKERSKIQVVSDQFMSPTGTDFIANSFFKMLEAKSEPGIYNVVNSGSASWYEFAKTIITKSGLECEVEPVSSSFYKTLALRPSYSVLDNTKLSDLIGPIDHWEKSLDNYLSRKGSLVVANN